MSAASDVRKAGGHAGEIIKQTGLGTKREFLGSSIDLADMKRLKIAHALAAEPELMPLDEAIAGLNRCEIQETVSR